MKIVTRRARFFRLVARQNPFTEGILTAPPIPLSRKLSKNFFAGANKKYGALTPSPRPKNKAVPHAPPPAFRFCKFPGGFRAREIDKFFTKYYNTSEKICLQGFLSAVFQRTAVICVLQITNCGSNAKIYFCKPCNVIIAEDNIGQPCPRKEPL